MEKRFPPLFRAWHWLTVVSVFGLLFTVLLRKTFLNKHAVAGIVHDKLASFGIKIDMEQAVAVAKAVRAPMWEWHYIFAVGLALAIGLRIAAMIRGEAKLPILALPAAEGLQEKFKALVHLLLCFLPVLLTVTGGFYYFHEALGFEKEAVHRVKELHETFLAPLVVLIGLHIAGVVRHELLTKEPSVSRMIHGDEIRETKMKERV